MEQVQTGYSVEHHREGDPRHLEAPAQRLDLVEQTADLRRSSAWRVHGHAAKTLVKYPSLRIVLLLLRAGTRVGRHRAPGTLVLQTLSGCVRISLPGQSLTVPAGALATLQSPEPHELEADDDSIVVLTLAWPATR